MSKKWKDGQGERFTYERLTEIREALAGESYIAWMYTTGEVISDSEATEGGFNIRFSSSEEGHTIFALSDEGMTLRLVEQNCTEEELSAALEKAGLVPVE